MNVARPFSSPYVRKLMASGADWVLSPYIPSSWWDEVGARVMGKRLERRFPSLWGWLFVTVTVDPEQFDSPEAAFVAGNERLRKMMFSLRRVGYRIPRYFWKLEMHASGWPHWHLGFDTRDYISSDVVAEAWGYGFAKVKRVTKRRDFRYLFKYVVKDLGQCPDWILDFPRRIRVFQTSAGFYGDITAARLAKESRYEVVEKRVTIREKLSHWATMGTVRMRASWYRAVPVVLRRSYGEIFCERVEQGARAVDGYHIPLIADTAEQYIEPWKPNRRLRNPPITSRRLISSGLVSALTP